MNERYDKLKKFILENAGPTAEKHAGIRIVPTMSDLDMVENNPMIGESAKADMMKLLNEKPKLCRLILTIMDESSELITNCANTGKIHLGWPWRMHKLENIFIYQHTYPKMLEEPMELLGYNRYMRLPWNFRIGLLVHLDFSAKDIAEQTQSIISVGNLWCGYAKGDDILVSHSSCVLVP